MRATLGCGHSGAPLSSQVCGHSTHPQVSLLWLHAGLFAGGSQGLARRWSARGAGEAGGVLPALGATVEMMMVPGPKAKAHTATGKGQPQLQHLSAARSCAGWGDGNRPMPDCGNRDLSPPCRDLLVLRDDSGNCCSA